MPIKHNICPCGKAFSSYNKVAIYCSIECYSNSRRTRKNVECLQCGTIFEARPSCLQKGISRYCSHECLSKAKISKRKLLICKNCGKTFSHVNKRQVFCSKQCYKNNRQNKITKTCETCHKEYVVKFSNNDRRFCSRTCFNKSTGETILEKLMREAIERQGIFYFQEYQFGKYVADFYLPIHFIVIECDGRYWHSSKYAKKRDKAKDKALNKLGITVFRFDEVTIKKDANKCVSAILKPKNISARTL